MATSSTVTSTGREFTAANTESLSINDNTDLSLPTGTQFSMGGWFYFKTLPAGGQHLMGKWSNSGGSNEYVLWMNSGTPTLQRGTASGPNPAWGSSLSTATWYFIDCGYDGTNGYINVNRGTPVTGAGYESEDGTDEFRIGAHDDGNRPADMIAQGCFFYKTTAATSTQLDDHYNSGSGKFYSDLNDTSNMISMWDMVESRGIGYDAHGSNDLTDNNTVTSAAGLISYTAEKSAQFTVANSEYLNISDVSQSGLSPESSSFYIASWVRADSLGADRMIITKWKSAGSTNEYQLAYINSVTDFRFIGSSDGSSVSFNINTNINPTIDTWYFVEAYYNGSTVGISVNRNTDVTAAYSSGIYASGDIMFGIGGQDPTGSGGGFQWDGRIGVSYFISGVPTTAERDALYLRGFGTNNAAKPTLSSASYVSVWNLNEESGTRSDSVGSNDLTDNNTVLQSDGIVLLTAAAGGTNTSGVCTLMGIGT